ncbi:hypothetical protein QBC46DRAFT_461010 [Diplogelasinospora grovesii]|uniref:Nucleoside phosphorylase domain-containing protein n=1 Tax=Diplogelasinospora grovesii TaxID=303347 RepID=A0AAN6N4E9_9PEZI|nr:hypothetical protein QBC46DRAFT_461010 [Diplogelasinospora grovesii]
MPSMQNSLQRPASRRDFEIAIICALTLEADAVDALFDRHWDDDGPPYDKAAGDRNAYSTGAIGRHNVVLAHMPGMGTANAAAVAANCQISFPNIRLAIVVGICGAVPFDPNGAEIVLGDVIISDGVVQYDFGRRLPERFVPKDTLLDSLGRPNAEIRALLAKLFEATYRHVADGKLCVECGCNGPLVPRSRLEQDTPPPVVHFGLVASGDTVMKSGEERDTIARQENVICFKMEGAGAWDSFPCVVIKGACDYADSHKTKVWQRYAAATAAACMKAFLDHWVPSLSSLSEPHRIPEQPAGPWFLVPYPKNDSFVGRTTILGKLQQLPLKSASQARVSLFGLGGIGNAERFRQSFTSIALECHIPGHDDPKVDVLPLVKRWLERKDRGWWLMVLNNADDAQFFFPLPDTSLGNCLGQYIPECAYGSILVTTRNKQAGLKLAKGTPPIEVGTMDDGESEQLLRANLREGDVVSGELLELSSRLEHLPLALVQAAAFIEANTVPVSEYLQLLDKSDQGLIDLLSEEFETVGRDSETPRAQQHAFAGKLLLLMSFLDRQAIPLAFLAEYGQSEEERKDQSLDVHRLWLAGKQWMDEFAGKALLAVDYENWVLCRAYLPHAYAVLRFEGIRSRDEEAGKAALLHCQWKDAERFQQEAFELIKAVLGEEHPSTLTSIANLASTFWNQGRWKEAESLQVQVMETRKRVLGEEHPSTLTSMANLASTYMNQGRWKEAESLEVQVMETRKRVLGEEHPDTLTSMANLASTFWNQGRWKEAESLQVQVIETRKRVLGEEHPSTLASMANLASTYMNQGRWKEAESLQVQVIETSLRNQGRWEEAEKLEVQAMETRKTKLGADHPDTLTSMANLALTWKSYGRHADALALMNDCAQAQQRVLGPKHPDTLSSLDAIAGWTS